MKHEVLDEMCNCVTIWVVSPSAIGKVRKYEPPSVLPFGRGFCSWKWAYLEWGHSTWRLVLELDLIRSNSWMMNEWLMDFRMENYRKWIAPIPLKKNIQKPWWIAPWRSGETAASATTMAGESKKARHAVWMGQVGQVTISNDHMTGGTTIQMT